MIDIHHHCLPGIDDGPRDMRSAVELCRRAFDEGITDIVATPHVHRDPWINGDRRILDRLREQLQSELGTEPRIHAGCEYFFNHDICRAPAGRAPSENPPAWDKRMNRRPDNRCRRRRAKSLRYSPHANRPRRQLRPKG